MTIKAAHLFTKDEAMMRSKNLISKVLIEYKGQYSNFTESWRDNVCDYHIVIKGQKISGRIKVDLYFVEVDISLPWTLTIFKVKIKTEIIRKLSHSLN